MKKNILEKEVFNKYDVERARPAVPPVAICELFKINTPILVSTIPNKIPIMFFINHIILSK